MIAAKSLRVGNIVSYDDGTPAYVNGIKHQDVYLEGFPQPLSERVIEGILLTPEILEKCGFVKDSFSKYGGWLIGIGEGERMRIIYIESIGWHWPLNEYRKPITNSLHQLQNLYFALTNKELQIKLTP